MKRWCLSFYFVLSYFQTYKAPLESRVEHLNIKDTLPLQHLDNAVESHDVLTEVLYIH